MNKIFADLVKIKNGEDKEHKYLFFKGDIYESGTRLVPITNNEVRAIIELVIRIVENYEKDKKNIKK